MALRLINSISKVARIAGANRSLTVCYAKSCLKPVAMKCHMLPMAHNFSTKLPEIVTYEEIKNLPKKPEALLIDVREPNELIETGIVPTSINIPLGQVAEKLSKDFSENDFLKAFNRKKPSFDQELIFMCKIGRRSHNAMEISRTLGYKNARNFLGSWQEWSKNEGLPN